MSAYRRDFDEVEYMHFLIKDDEFLEKYNEIWKTINKNFHNNKILNEGSQFICLSVILMDSIFGTGKNYYSQLFLEEYKYTVKEKMMAEYIPEKVEFSPDTDREDSNEENSDEENFDEEN